MTGYSNVYIALGANIGDCRQAFKKAIFKIDSQIGKVVRVSKFYKTAALNPPEIQYQPDFLNAALLCQSTLSPRAILEKLMSIETALGRNREQEIRWGPRIIDLDLIAVDDIIIDSPEIKLPHPEMQNRDFVLKPLAEIEPNFEHPLSKINIAELRKRLVERKA